MGGDPYWYVVPYDPDIDAALQRLREREFKAGRYNPVMPFPQFPILPYSPSPGTSHGSYEEALEASEADGTRSIIDLQTASLTPNDGPPVMDFTVWPLSNERLTELFGTTAPSLEAILEQHQFWDGISRGSGAYVVLHKDGEPHEIFFAGYSVD